MRIKTKLIGRNHTLIAELAIDSTNITVAIKKSMPNSIKKAMQTPNSIYSARISKAISSLKTHQSTLATRVYPTTRCTRLASQHTSTLHIRRNPLDEPFTLQIRIAQRISQGYPKPTTVTFKATIIRLSRLWPPQPLRL